MQSDNLRLLAHTPDHLRALMEGPEDYQLQFGIAVADGVSEFLTGPEVSEPFLARLRGEVPANPWSDGFGIVQLAENRLIGLCSFNGPPDADGTVELSYGIAPGYAGRGYATEAARCLTAHAFSSDRVRVVQAHTLPENNASTKVLKKCGFKHCGELIDAVDGPIWLWEIQRVDLPCRPMGPSPPST